MVNWFENYVNSFPDTYALFAPLMMIPCVYKTVYGLSDMPRFESSYYRLSAIKGLLGFVCCVFMLWPIPLIWGLVNLARNWNTSEIEEVWAYEERRKKRENLKDARARTGL